MLAKVVQAMIVVIQDIYPADIGCSLVGPKQGITKSRDETIDAETRFQNT